MGPKYSNRHSRSLQARMIILQKENQILRELLWLRHGCMGLYGDDGEMQCNSCIIDFKRDSVLKIKDRFEEMGRKAVKDLFQNNLPVVTEFPETPPTKPPKKSIRGGSYESKKS